MERIKKDQKKEECSNHSLKKFFMDTLMIAAILFVTFLVMATIIAYMNGSFAKAELEEEEREECCDYYHGASYTFDIYNENGSQIEGGLFEPNTSYDANSTQWHIEENVDLDRLYESLRN